MYGQADISTVGGGDVAAAMGPTYSESVDIAAETLSKEQAYQAKRLRILCAPTRMASGRGGMIVSKEIMSTIKTNKAMKYALIGLIGYLAYKGLRG